MTRRHHRRLRRHEVEHRGGRGDAGREGQGLAALELAKTFEITGNRLDLFRPGHTFAVTFARP